MDKPIPCSIVLWLTALCLSCGSICASETLPEPATRPSAPPAIEKPGWVLTFHDEFDGDHLDQSKWSDHYYHGRTHDNDELEWYAPYGWVVGNGVLRLAANPAPPDKRGSTEGKPYTSGMIEGSGKFAQKFGWFEIRAKFPAGKGYWPAFWLLPATLDWPPEIDILEILGDKPDTVYFTTHWKDQEGKHQEDEHHWVGPDFSKDYHTFAVDWEPGLVIWYVDGIERARTTRGVPAEPMYIIANLAVGGDWPGSPDQTTPFPGYMDVECIRVYRHK